MGFSQTSLESTSGGYLGWSFLVSGFDAMVWVLVRLLKQLVLATEEMLEMMSYRLTMSCLFLLHFKAPSLFPALCFLLCLSVFHLSAFPHPSF